MQESSGLKPLLSRVAIVPLESIIKFCQRWQVQEFSLFGSVLRDDFRANSDIDVMVNFQPSARWGLLALVEMKELEAIFERDVDLLSKNQLNKARIGFAVKRFSQQRQLFSRGIVLHCWILLRQDKGHCSLHKD